MSNPTYEVESESAGGEHVWILETWDLNAPNCPAILFVGGFLSGGEQLPTNKTATRRIGMSRMQARERGFVQ